MIEVTPLDESFGHQLVAPRATMQHDHQRWAERTYYLLHVDDDLTINTGRQLYRNAGHWQVFTAATRGDELVALRQRPAYAPGDDPDDPQVGPVRLEVVRPLQATRLILDDPSSPLAFDLTYEARFDPVAHEPTLVEKGGEVVTHTMSFFQSGLFSGTIALDGDERHVQRRAGFRDRSWGVRKHDGAPRRGLVLFVAAEFEDEALYVLLFETASGRRVSTDGWLMDDSGLQDRVIGAEHDLEFAPAWMAGGALDLQMASGEHRRLTFRTQTRLFLPSVGYSPDPARKQPGLDRFDISDPAVARSLEGQTDHGSVFDLDGAAGYGYAEVGRGTHPRYRPDGP